MAASEAVPRGFDTTAYTLAWLLPLGIALMAWGGTDDARARQVAAALPLAFVLALVGYALTGFALQYGGLALVETDLDLGPLTAEWSPLDLALGEGWGLMGLRGFALQAPQMAGDALWLFLAELPMVVAATSLPLVTLRGRAPRLPTLFLAALVAAILYPLAGNWVRGGGWLSHLPKTIGLAASYVDHGAASGLVVGGCAALAGLVAFGRRGYVPQQPASELMPASSPLGVLVGLALAAVGWGAWWSASPLTTSPADPLPAALNALFALGGAAAGATFYSWLVRNEAQPGWVGRGISLGLIAVAPGLPHFGWWTAALIGVVGGLFSTPIMYLVDRFLNLDDRGGVIGVYAFGGLLGLLSVGLMAHAPDAGVVGYAMPAEWGHESAQLIAQLIGAGALLVWGGVLPGIVLTLAARAYAVPHIVQQRAHQRRARSVAQRKAAWQDRLKGTSIGPWQRANRAWLRAAAASDRARLCRTRRRLQRSPSPRSPRSRTLRRRRVLAH